MFGFLIFLNLFWPLFKPLFSTKDKGNGLGLSISYRLIQAQNGLLSYLPGNPKGSIFQIFLPQKQ